MTQYNHDHQSFDLTATVERLERELAAERKAREEAEAQVKVLREALEEQLKLWYGGEEMSDIGLRRWEETAYQKARAALATTEAQRGEE